MSRRIACALLILGVCCVTLSSSIRCMTEEEFETWQPEDEDDEFPSAGEEI